MPGIVAELAAQPLDVGAHDLGIVLGAFGPDPAQEGLVGQDPAGALGKNAQQLELGRRQRHRAPGHGDLAPVVVDGEVPEHERGRRRAPAQDRPDPRRELGRGEGLDDVVVGAGLERAGDGLVAPVAGDEDDGQVGELRNGLHELDPVGPGQHQVEQHQPGLLGQEDAPYLAVVAGDQGGEAGVGERVADMAQRFRVIVDHEDGHRFGLRAGPVGAVRDGDRRRPWRPPGA